MLFSSNLYSMDPAAEIAQRLTDAARRSGGQSQLARRVNVTDSAVSKWVAGNGLDGWVRLRLVAQALNVSADWLLGLSDDARPPGRQSTTATIPVATLEEIAHLGPLGRAHRTAVQLPRASLPECPDLVATTIGRDLLVFWRDWRPPELHIPGIPVASPLDGLLDMTLLVQLTMRAVPQVLRCIEVGPTDRGVRITFRELFHSVTFSTYIEPEEDPWTIIRGALVLWAVPTPITAPEASARQVGYPLTHPTAIQAAEPTPDPHRSDRESPRGDQ